MPHINEHPIGGTTLINGVAELNAEPEHMRIGVSWSLIGGLLYIDKGPRKNANMANPLGFCEEIQRHLESGGVSFDWYFTDGRCNTFTVTSRGIRHNL